jgi:hypothetical protein
MKNLLFSAALGLISMTAFAQPEAMPVGGKGAMISVDKDAHDYGTLKQGGNGDLRVHRDQHRRCSP